MRTCPVQIKLYIPFQPRSQKASTVATNTNKSSKDAPIAAVAIDRPSQKAIRPQPVLAPLHRAKLKEPDPTKLTETPAPMRAGGNKRAISLLSIINPPKRTISLPPFSASPEISKKKNKQHKHAKRRKKNETRQPNTPKTTKAEPKLSPSKLVKKWSEKSKP